MLLRAHFVKRPSVLNRKFPLLRSFASRGLQEERTKQVIEEIKKLESELESKTKQRATQFEKIDEQDVASIYKELSAPTPVKPKISADYLAKLRIKFLDTRHLEEQHSAVAQLPSSDAATEKSSDSLIADTTTTAATDASSNGFNLSVQDFEQLIYANALAKRPLEAEKAFDLMATYNIVPSLKAVNHLMDAYANTNNVEQTIATFKRLDDLNLKPDVFTYGALVKAFVIHKRLDDAFVVFEKMKNSSIIPSQPIFSSLISGCLKANKVEKAWELFDSMRLSYHQPDEVSYTLMLHACAKKGEVERALNLFEDMAGYQLHPTDVTFNVLINACAKRPDYYNEAFSLLEQMQTSYGFQPDKITYNTLLTACSRKKDLKQARHILQTMWQDVEINGSNSLLKPDSTTYTNLFWCYASYHITASGNQQRRQSDLEPTTTMALSTERHLLPANVPNKRSLVVQEAEWLFKQMDKDVKVTSALLTSFLTVHISQKPTTRCVDIYTNLFDQYGVEKDAFTFKHMLQYCYNTKNKALAWKVWEDYQDFLESRNKRFETSTSSEIEKKTIEAEKNALAIKEGWKSFQQQNLAVLMANTLARSNDTKNALGVLTSEIRRSSVLAPHLREMMPVYNKCIQLEDEQTKKELVRICIKDQKRTGNSKYKRVNRTDD